MTHLGSRKVVWIVALVLLAMVIAALACGPVPATPMPTPTLAPTPTPTPERAAPEANKGASSKGTAGSAGLQPGSSGQVTLTLVNDLNEAVCYVYISPTTDTSWGSDWLGSDEVISAGGRRNFTASAGVYDLMAADCDGNELASEYAYAMNGDTTWTLSWSAARAGGSAGGASGGSAGGSGGAAAQPYTIANNSAIDICYVYISPTTSDSWGADWLGSSIIPAGTQYTFYVTPGSYDILLTDCSGNTLDQQMGVALRGGETLTYSGGSAGGSSGGGAQPYTIVNNSATDICYVYISSATSSEWGSDWLGSDVLYAGSSYTFYVTPGSYDILLEDCNGNALDQQMDVYLSGGETWYFAGGGPATSGGGSATLTLFNNTGMDICYVYISPATSSEWGSDWLGSDTVPAGTSYTFWVTPDTYDMKAEDCSHNVIDEQYDVWISGAMSWDIAGGQPGGGAAAGVTFVNQTSSQICYIWIGAPQSEWAGDALGSSVLEAYSSITVSIEPGTWALQAETCDGVVVYYHPGIQLYNGVTVYLSPD